MGAEEVEEQKKRATEVTVTMMCLHNITNAAVVSCILVWFSLTRFSYLLFHFLIYRIANAYSYAQIVFMHTSYYWI